MVVLSFKTDVFHTGQLLFFLFSIIFIFLGIVTVNVLRIMHFIIE